MFIKNYKKISAAIITFFASSVLVAFAASAKYVPLSGESLNNVGISPTTGVQDLGTFLGQIYNFGIAAAVALAVVMLIWGGIKKMTTDSWQAQDEAKKIITDALLGLGLALISYLILYTINPCLVNFSACGNKLLTQ